MFSIFTVKKDVFRKAKAERDRQRKQEEERKRIAEGGDAVAPVPAPKTSGVEDVQGDEEVVVDSEQEV